MSEILRGKVAKILNSRELVINIGSDHGVCEGMYFDVLDSKGENITDPDTGEVLGSIDRPKLSVKVSRVEPRLAVAATYRSNRVNVGGSGSGLSALSGFDSIAKQLMPPKWVTKYETLKTDERTWEDVNEEDCFVKTGDPVRQVVPRREEVGPGGSREGISASDLQPEGVDKPESESERRPQ
jgi:hypothetical protein